MEAAFLKFGFAVKTFHIGGEVAGFQFQGEAVSNVHTHGTSDAEAGIKGKIPGVLEKNRAASEVNIEALREGGLGLGGAGGGHWGGSRGVVSSGLCEGYSQ